LRLHWRQLTPREGLQLWNKSPHLICAEACQPIGVHPSKEREGIIKCSLEQANDVVMRIQNRPRTSPRMFLNSTLIPISIRLPWRFLTTNTRMHRPQITIRFRDNCIYRSWQASFHIPANESPRVHSPRDSPVQLHSDGAPRAASISPGMSFASSKTLFPATRRADLRPLGATCPNASLQAPIKSIDS
jgi:hypothetical protein